MDKGSPVLTLILGLMILVVPALAGPPVWETLFDGSNIDAFEVCIKGNPAGTFFDVADGVIRTYPGFPEGQNVPNGMLVTKKQYSGFHLRWEYRYDGRKFRGTRNSGVMYHVQGTEVWPVCMEFQLMEGNGGWPVFMYTQARIPLTGGRYDPKGQVEEVGVLGKIQSRQGATTAEKPIGQWNRGELLVTGNRAYHVVNGQVIACLEGLKQPNADKTEWIGLNGGRIAFQCEGAGIEFRNIEVQENPVGYIDTPLIPGQPWRVHDNARPQPPQAQLPPYDPRPVPAPADAVVLLDKDTYRFTSKEWEVKDGVMTVHRVGDKSAAQQSTIPFGDGHYHIEWSAPTEIKGASQGRGNSGIFPMGDYEIQVLDNWDNRTYPDGMAGAIYGQMPPLANAVRKCGEWNICDILFKAPVFDDAKVVTPAYATVLLNGVVVQNNQEILGATVHRQSPHYTAHPSKVPLSLQDHNNPVRFRNIWVRPLDRDDTQR